MRLELLYNPRLLIERIAIESIRRRRRARLKKTPANRLLLGHIDSLELLDLSRDLGISVIYDIGANVGTWTLLAKSIMPDAQIHAFEPLPLHQDVFVEKVERLNSVTLHKVALGSKHTSAMLHVTDFSDASSILPLAKCGQSHFGIRETNQIPVELTSLDKYCRTRRLPWPDLMKLDVQGYELEVLKGGAECLENTKAVITEVSFVSFYEGQCLFDNVVRFMSDAGFHLRALGVNTPLGSLLYQTDALFVVSSLASPS